MRKFGFAITIIIGLAWTMTSGCAAKPGEPAVSVDSVENEACVVRPPAEPVACTMQYDPVCGCDGITYGNACMARGAGVPHSTPGACDENPND